jgi:hypothetical protein
MAYQNFIPALVEAGVIRELDEVNVFASTCKTDFEGAVSARGETVKFKNLGTPTVHNLTRASKNADLPEREVIEDFSILLPINQLAQINFEVSDIDAEFADENLKAEHEKKIARAFNKEIEKYIGNLALGKNVLKVVEAGTVTEENATKSLDKAFVALAEANPSIDALDLHAIVDPAMYVNLKNKYLSESTNNVKEWKNGKVGEYANIEIRMSNNVARDESGNRYIMVKTKDAIGYARPVMQIEAYRPEGSFKDAIKAQTLYDAKILLPKEIVVIKASYEA